MASHIVLVHGAWHNEQGFTALRSELDARGITSSTVSLASAAAADGPIGDMYGDAELVRDHVKNLGRDCFVLAHSYGGLPVTQGLTDIGSVKGLIFLTAFVLDENETLFQACGAQDPPWWVRGPDAERLTTSTPQQVFYNSCTDKVAIEAVVALRTQSVLSFNQPITKVAWKEIPSTYILCAQDNAIPLVAQEAMSTRTNHTVTMNTDHSPFLSAPKDLAVILDELMH